MTVSDGRFSPLPEVHDFGGYADAVGDRSEPDPAEGFVPSAEALAAFGEALAVLDPQAYGSEALRQRTDDMLVVDLEDRLAQGNAGIRSVEAMSIMISPEQLLQTFEPEQAAVCAVLGWEIARRALESQATWRNPGGAA